jgi:hypothetical protein|tara:strand:- start:2068 stop:2451 length:384 start_codon:yes stop_codon:yes gene_type:complete
MGKVHTQIGENIMNHISVEDALVQELLENAAWSQIGKPGVLLEENPSNGAEKVDEANMFGNEDSQDVISEDTETEEAFSCPMCESELDEILSDEQIMECVVGICDVLEELNEESLSEELEYEDEDED